MTEAGKKLVEKYLAAEAAGTLFALRDLRTGELFYGMALETNNGGQKAAAEKLVREGYGKMQWSRSFGSHRGRYFWLTPESRAKL